MKLSQTLPAISLAFALTAPLALLARADSDALPSGPTATQATTAKLVYGLLSDSRYAYRPRALDDTLSQEVFTRYLESLDPGKVFLTAQDMAKFASYKTRLDDAIKGEGLEPAYAMFALYKQRVNQRVAYARGLLKGQNGKAGHVINQGGLTKKAVKVKGKAKKASKAEPIEE